MTAFGGLKTSGYVCGKHEKIEKVIGSQDDNFVVSLKGILGRGFWTKNMKAPTSHYPNDKKPHLRRNGAFVSNDGD